MGDDVDVRARGRNQLTALMYAAHKGNVEIVKALLNNGANKNQNRKNGECALDLAKKKNFRGTIRVIRITCLRE